MPKAGRLNLGCSLNAELTDLYFLRISQTLSDNKNVTGPQYIAFNHNITVTEAGLNVLLWQTLLWQWAQFGGVVTDPAMTVGTVWWRCDRPCYDSWHSLVALWQTLLWQLAQFGGVVTDPAMTVGTVWWRCDRPYYDSWHSLVALWQTLLWQWAQFGGVVTDPAITVGTVWWRCDRPCYDSGHSLVALWQTLLWQLAQFGGVVTDPAMTVGTVWWRCDRPCYDSGHSLVASWRKHFEILCICWQLWPPKGAKVYPASRRRSNKRVGLKGQLAPHCVPWLKNSIMAYKRLSTSLGSKSWTTPPWVWGEPKSKTQL